MSEVLRVLAATASPSPEDIHSCPATSSSRTALFNPCGLAVSSGGRIYVADTGHHRICVVDDGILSVLAGSGARGYADGEKADAAFAHPCGLAIDSEGMLYVADCGNHRIRMVTPDGVVSTIAGCGVASHRDGQGRAACFNNPCGIAIDSNDTLYIADYSNNCVRIVSKGGVAATIASKEAKEDATLDSPYGIAVHLEHFEDGSSAAWVYVSSYHSNSLAMLSPDGRVGILAGCGAARHQDGVGFDAAFRAPNGLAIDAEGKIYLADSGNHCVRQVLHDGTVTTLAGNGQGGLNESQFNSPCGLCVCVMPNVGPCLLITDRSNSCVRLLKIDALPQPRIAPSTLRQDLRQLLDGGAEDVVEGEAVFEVEGRVLRASKAVLCVRSHHFRAMFTSGMREATEAVVKIPDINYTSFRALLDYLLTDEISTSLEVEETLSLLMVANRYGVHRLEQLCETRLALRLNAQSVHEVAECANLIGCSQLARAAAKYIATMEGKGTSYGCGGRERAQDAKRADGQTAGQAAGQAAGAA